MNTALPKVFVMVSIPTIILCVIVYQGWFSKTHTDVGFQYYAEVPHEIYKMYLPKWVKMPFNTVINAGFVIVGAVWCAITSVYLEHGQLTEIDAFVMYFFNMGTVFYGPIQTLRILTQKHGFAVLDQWYTLPFFMWTFVWSLYITRGWSLPRAVTLMLLSLTSYCLTLYHKQGFEMALAGHIVFAVIGGVSAYWKYPAVQSRFAIVAAIFCCSGFVGLKLLDLDLPNYHPIFSYISGHFLSKICDILQIHFVNRYYFNIILYKLQLESKKKD